MSEPKKCLITYNVVQGISMSSANLDWNPGSITHELDNLEQNISPCLIHKTEVSVWHDYLKDQ